MAYGFIRHVRINDVWRQLWRENRRRALQFWFCFLISVSCIMSATVVSADGNYDDAVRLFKTHRLDDAEKIARKLVEDPAQTQNARKQINAQILNLLGVIELARAKPDLHYAEGCFAWAMYEDSSELSYWNNYIATRSDRQKPGQTQRLLSENEFELYGSEDIFVSTSKRGESFLSVPFERGIGINSAWGLLRGLLDQHEGWLARAESDIDAIKTNSSPGCAVLQAVAWHKLCGLALEAAAQNLDRAEDCAENSYTTRFLQGRLARLDNRYDEAERLLAQAMVLDVLPTSARQERLLIALDTASTPEARIASLEKTINSDPGIWNPWSLLWREYQNVNIHDMHDLIDFARQCRTHSNTIAAPNAAEALARLSEGNIAQADECIRRAVQEQPASRVYQLGALLIAILERDVKDIKRRLAKIHEDCGLLSYALEEANFPTEFGRRGKLKPETTISLINKLRDLDEDGPFSSMAYCALPEAIPSGEMSHERMLSEVINEIFISQKDLRERDQLIMLRINVTELELAQMRGDVDILRNRLDDLEAWRVELNRNLAANLDELKERLDEGDQAIAFVMEKLGEVVLRYDDELLALGLRQDEMFSLLSQPSRSQAENVLKISEIISLGPSIGPLQLDLLPVIEWLWKEFKG